MSAVSLSRLQKNAHLEGGRIDRNILHRDRRFQHVVPSILPHDDVVNSNRLERMGGELVDSGERGIQSGGFDDFGDGDVCFGELRIVEQISYCPKTRRECERLTS